MHTHVSAYILFLVEDTIFTAALYDVKALDDAVGNAKNMIDFAETLFIVSADHSHTFSIGSYGLRGSNLFGLGEMWSEQDDENAFIR